MNHYVPVSNYCDQWKPDMKTKNIYHTCTNIWPAYLAAVEKLRHSESRIKKIMENEIPAVLP